jgi:hypothetical protein
VQPSRRGSGGVGIFSSPKAAKDWSSGGSKITKGGLSIGDTTRYMEITLNTIKSSVIIYNILTLVSNYFPDSNKSMSEFQEFLDTFYYQVRSIDQNSFIDIGVNTNASLGRADPAPNNRSQGWNKQNVHTVQGPHGNPYLNKIGELLRNTMRECQLKDLTRFTNISL